MSLFTLARCMACTPSALTLTRFLSDAAFLTDLFSSAQSLVQEYQLRAYWLIVKGQDFPQLHFQVVSPLGEVTDRRQAIEPRRDEECEEGAEQAKKKALAALETLGGLPFFAVKKRTARKRETIHFHLISSSPRTLSRGERGGG